MKVHVARHPTRALPLALFFALFLAPPAAVASETLVIEAPWLVGTVTPHAVFNGVLVLPDDVTTVLGASLEVSGLATEGTIICIDDPNVYPASVAVATDFFNACTSAVSGYFHWEVEDLTGEVTLSAPVVWHPFGGGSPAPWSCWVGQPVNVQLYWAYGLIGICGFGDLPSFEITEARFVVEVERVVVSSAATWSTVKARYR